MPWLFRPPALAKEAAPPSHHHHPRLQHSPHLLPVDREPSYRHSAPSHTRFSLPSGRDRSKLQRRQSLLRDSTTDSLVRHRSSKRRHDRDHDQAREDEVRAMSLAMPQKRPAGSSGGLRRRESKKIKGGSHVSLAPPRSLHSSMSSHSDRGAFRASAFAVNPFDMFSPRPTIRCSVGSECHVSRSSPNGCAEEPEWQRERRPISDQEPNRSRRTSRIDDLADSLDAGELRAIMERDKRRREKKASFDTERLRRRLERRAEKDRAGEAGGMPITPRQEAARPVVGLGIEKETLMDMEDVQPSTPQHSQPLRRLPSTPTAPENHQPLTPLASPAQESAPSGAPVTRSVSGAGHARGPSNVSQLPELISERWAQERPVQFVEKGQSPTKSGSWHADGPAGNVSPTGRASIRRLSLDIRRAGVIASLFRRGKRGSQDRGQASPSEVSFSNTSRESMPRQPPPPPLLHSVGAGPGSGPALNQTPSTGIIPTRKSESVPRRTKSKFREDLPEYPVSPPGALRTTAAHDSMQIPASVEADAPKSPDSNRSYSPTSPTPLVSNIMSQSLASIDSEASWLSGKPVKRASAKSHLRSSGGSAAVQPHQEYTPSYEELGVTDEEFFSRSTPQPEDPLSSKRSSGVFGSKANATLHVSASSEKEQLIRDVEGHLPTIVHRKPQYMSNHGVLDFIHDSAASPEDVGSECAESPTSDTEFGTVQRAHSVDLGKQHARHVSAGSAKLLNIKRTSSNSHNNKSE